MNTLADIVSIVGAVINEEIMTFLCALALYLIMHNARNSRAQREKRNLKNKIKPEKEVEGTSIPDNTSYAKIDKSLHAAFESEDYFQVLASWRDLKKFRKCPPIHISQIIKAMQCCNKTSYAIAGEVKDYLKAYPEKRNICLVNDIIEPLARSLDDRTASQLVDFLMNMLPSVGLSKDARTYEILLTMHVAKWNHAKVQDIVAEMKANAVVYTPCARVAVLTMALQLNNVEAALKAFAALKPSWDLRSAWAVSPFALQRHKANMLGQIVKLACEKHRLDKLMPLLSDMVVPEDVMELARAEQKRLKPGPMSKRVHVDLCSDASTSEGTRSDSESGDEDFAVRPPPRLHLPPPGF